MQAAALDVPFLTSQQLPQAGPAQIVELGQSAFLRERLLISFLTDVVQKADWSSPEPNGCPRRLRTPKHEAIAVVLTCAYACGIYSSREIEELSAGKEPGFEWLSQFALTSLDFQRFRRWNPNFLAGCLAQALLGQSRSANYSPLKFPRSVSSHFSAFSQPDANEDEAILKELAHAEARRLAEAVARDSHENDD